MKTLTVILVLIINTSGDGTIEREYPMPDINTCSTSVVQAQVHNNTGNENEKAVALFCAYKEKN